MEWYLVGRASPEAVCFVGVEAENLNRSFDAEVMEDAADLQGQQVLL